MKAVTRRRMGKAWSGAFRARAATALGLAVLLTGCSSIARSAYDGDVATVTDYLRSGGANDRFDAGGCARCTLLHHAAWGGQVQVAKLLVAKGADVNATNEVGVTPLYAACSRQHADMVRFLLASGAKPSLAMRDPAGGTPLVVAVFSVKEQGRWVFVPTPGGGTTAVSGREKAAGPSLEIVDLLLAGGADLATATDQGNTPLHIAAYRGHAKVVDLLLARGADPRVRNAKGETPETLALQHGQAEMARKLREAAR